MLTLFVLVTLFITIQGHTHSCIHDDLKTLGLQGDIVHAPGEPTNDDKRRQIYSPNWQAFRMVVDSSAFGESQFKQWILNRVMPDVVDYFSRALSVHRNDGPTKLNPLCLRWYTNPYQCIQYQTPTKCGDLVTIPQSYFDAGFDGDFVVFVTGEPTQGNVIAYASHCQTSGATYSSTNPTPSRPIAGFINFGSQATIDYNSEEIRQAWIKTAIHETMHALGFSASLFPTFWDPNTRQTRAQVTIQTNERGGLQNKLVLPTVLQVAREHFGCPTLNGVELEDQGGSGTAGSHWEMRIIMDEVMKGILMSPQQYEEVTKLSLAVFQDSGWYSVDFSQAKPQKWGKGEGCSFTNDKCVVNGQPSNKYWCTQSTALGCDLYRKSKAVCGLGTYGSAITPANYQYFSQANVGGNLPTADYCPWKRARGTQFGSFIQTGPCGTASNRMEPNNWGESYGDMSYCMTSTLIKKGIAGSHYPSQGVGCYTVSNCNPKDQSFNIFVEGREDLIRCLPESTITLDQFQGSLTCPPYLDVCSN